MAKLFLSFILIISFISADSILLLQKGWQLIGASERIADMSKFDSASVEQVLHFDASTQSWLGYSPDKTIQSKMSAKGILTLSSLEKWHGFWVKSREEWALVLGNSSLSQAPESNTSGDIVMLKKGWNLISLPIDSVVSADIFRDFTLWKYNANKEWEFFDNNYSENSFPRLGHIKNSDGLWIQAQSDTNISIMNEASKLHNFKNSDDMREYILEMSKIFARPYWGFEPFIMAINTVEVPLSAPIANDTGEIGSTKDSTQASNTSNTNLQEVDVDEADIIKHNSTHIFYKVSINGIDSVFIKSFNSLVENNSSVLNKISFEDNRSISDMYLIDNTLVVLSYLSYTNYKMSFDVVSSMPYPQQSLPNISIDMFDISSIDKIKSISNYDINGSLVTSRVVGGKLYLVTQFSPHIKITYPQIDITLSSICESYFRGLSNNNNYQDYSSCYNIQKDYQTSSYYRLDYQNPNIEVVNLVPNIRGDKLLSTPLVTPQRLYAPSKLKQNSTITTLSQFEILSGKYIQSNSIIGYTDIQYASNKALYLLSTQYPWFYDFNNYKERSTIYKFGFDDNLSYKGVGDVYGHIVNQFAMSEYNDILRIATTEGFSWGGSGTNNSIYTLKEEGKSLKIQGILTGLGKKDESIKSVRFMGNRAYVVTFRQTDPLYTIDMSLAIAPKKAGELQINGYSDYLHPIGEDRLLGIGRDADSLGAIRGIKIELFDVSDFANPSSLDSIILSDNTYSEISYNHKALAYRSSDNLFAFPYQEYINYTNNNYLGVYQVRDNLLIDYKNIAIDRYNWSQKRGLIFDINNITYISFFANDTIVTKILEER